MLHFIIYFSRAIVIEPAPLRRAILPDQRERRVKALREAFSRPEVLARMAAVRTAEWRANIGEKSRGRKHTDEWKAAASSRMTGKKRGPYKRHATPEQIAKRGDAIRAAYARKRALREAQK